MLRCIIGDKKSSSTVKTEVVCEDHFGYGGTRYHVIVQGDDLVIRESFVCRDQEVNIPLQVWERFLLMANDVIGQYRAANDKLETK